MRQVEAKKINLLREKPTERLISRLSQTESSNVLRVSMIVPVMHKAIFNSDTTSYFLFRFFRNKKKENNKKEIYAYTSYFGD